MKLTICLLVVLAAPLWLLWFALQPDTAEQQRARASSCGASGYFSKC